MSPKKKNEKGIVTPSDNKVPLTEVIEKICLAHNAHGEMLEQTGALIDTIIRKVTELDIKVTGLEIKLRKSQPKSFGK